MNSESRDSICPEQYFEIKKKYIEYFSQSFEVLIKIDNNQTN